MISVTEQYFDHPLCTLIYCCEPLNQLELYINVHISIVYRIHQFVNNKIDKNVSTSDFTTWHK